MLTPEALELVRQAAEERAAALVTMTLLALAQQALSVLEVYLILRWLGTDPSPASAIMFEGAIKIVNAAGTVVPGRLGIYEGASGVLADALRLGAAAGPARRWRGARGRSSGP